MKDSNGRVTVVVRCIAPNESSWFFHWLFQETLPVLLGTQSQHSVNFFMTDSDSQEMSQVDFAISTYLPMQYILNVGGILWIKAGEKL
jgi:hypothetical protein